MAQNSHDSGRKCEDVSIKIDRLSNLPEEIICHILSFLPTRDAVKTNLVSPKFLNLWKNITTLSFSHHTSDWSESSKKFVMFVYRVFLRLKTRCIHKFSIELSCSNPGYKWIIEHLSNWVDAAIERKVKHIVYSDRCGRTFLQLSSCISTCDSLEILELRNIIVILNKTSSVRLPNLRILRMEIDERLLRNAIELPLGSIIGDECVGIIVSGCPSLHTLYLSKENAFKLSFCSPTLEHLTIISRLKDVSSSKFFDSNNDVQGRIQIDAPALKYLHIKVPKLKYWSIRTSSRLIVGEIFVGAAKCGLVSLDYLKETFSNVKVLVLDVSDAWLSDAAKSGLVPMFPNLTSLTLCNFYNELNFVKELLHKSPTLETLCLKCVNQGKYAQICPNEISVSPSRKMVKVEDFYDEIDQLRVLKYILMNGSLLDTMEIMTDTECTRKLEQLQISNNQRKSEYCMIRFYSEDCVTKIFEIATKTPGFQKIGVDKKNGMITVTGAMDMNALAENVKKALGTNVEIVTPCRNLDTPPRSYTNEPGYYSGGGWGQFQNLYGVYQSHSPRMFRDAAQMFGNENPNACSVM